MGKPSEAHEELLARAAATGLSDREIEKQVPLAQAFMAKARRGGNDSARAESSWEKLGAWLNSRQAAAVDGRGPVVSPSPAAAGPTTETSAAGQAKRAALVRQMREAASLEDSNLTHAMIAEGLGEGWLSGTVSQRMLQVADSQRKTIALILEAKARAKNTGPMRIEVVYVQDWRTEGGSSSPPTPSSPSGSVPASTPPSGSSGDSSTR